MASKKNKQAETFAPSSPLGEAIIAGDNDRVLAILAAYDDKGRVAARAEALAAREHVEAGEWGQLPGQENTYGFITAFSDEQRAAAATAVIVLGTAKQAVEAIGRDTEEAFALLQRFRPTYLPELAAVLVEARFPNVDLAQALITAGLSTRPTSDAYVLGLIRWAESVRWRRHQDASSSLDLYSLVLSDKGLVDDGVVLRLFEVEGTREVSLGIQDKYGKGDSWSDVLVRLVDDGHLGRDVVIDATLSAIERDWPQFRGGWYLRFLEALALRDAEHDARAERFLALLSSRIPPTVSVALDVVAGFVARDSIAAIDVLSSLLPVAAARGKGQVKTALKLAATLRKRHVDDDSVRDAVHRLAIEALVNDDATLQETALTLLDERRSADNDSALRAATDLVAPRLRTRVATMTGTAVSTTKPATTAAPPATVSVASTMAMDPGHVDVPVADDLLDVVARAFESNDDPLVLEQAVAGLVQHADSIRAAKKTWAALRKRANTIDRPLSSSVAGLLIAIVDDVAIEPPRWTHGVETLFLNRAVELRRLPAGLVPLGTCTRSDGSIDVDVLVARVAAFAAAGVDVDTFVVDGQVALLRLFRLDVDDAIRAAVVALPASAFVAALRVAVGIDDVDASFVTTSPFALAAYRRRHGPYALSAPPTIGWVRHHREKFPDYSELIVARASLATPPHAQALQLIDKAPERYRNGMLADGDYGMVRFALTLWPAALDALLIDGVVSVAGNVSWAEACWQHRALVESLHDRRLTMRSSSSLATMMMVLCLCGKEAGHVTIAVDALVAGIADGRVDVDAVGAVASQVLDEGLVLGKRLASALKAASDVDAATADAVRRLLERALSGDPARAPRDVGALLSLLVHLRVDVAAPLPPATRAYLQGLTGGGQVAKEKKLLLA